MTTGIRICIFAIIAVASYFAWTSYQGSMAELKDLRSYKASIEDRNKVSDVGENSYRRQKESGSHQITSNEAQRIIIETKTAEVAHEDPATADFLNLPIPERLREADREARLARGLATGQGSPGADGAAN